MEDENCSVNEEGLVDVRYRGWTEINPMIWTFKDQIVHLNLSFNRLQSLPENIGILRRLKYLNCENNEIDNIPESIGKIRPLREMNLNKNKLIRLPGSIGNCSRLEKLYLNDNCIEMIPKSIGECICLEYVSLRNNRLIELPLSIAKLEKQIKQIDVSYNPNLSTIPEKVQGDSEAIMLILVQSYQKTTEIETIRQGIKDMSKLIRRKQYSISKTKRDIDQLRGVMRDLEFERDRIMTYLKFRSFRERMRSRMWSFIQQSRELFERQGHKVVAE